jgi:ectoine hydroxylase-related dioxygenase (phytanoyl-CoA dioxygenase family)
VSGPAAASPWPETLEVRFDVLGIAVVEYALTPPDLAAMDALFPRLGDRAAGARADMFSQDARAWLAAHAGLTELARRLSWGLNVRLTRLQAFDKSPSANWFVPWHQDRAEDGQDRPVALLERTVALRIHLDDCGEDNGPLEVIPASHRQGRLDSAAIGLMAAKTPPVLCLAVRGDIVAMRPLIVHRSQRARIPRARRVLHLEYQADG